MSHHMLPSTPTPLSLAFHNSDPLSKPWAGWLSRLPVWPEAAGNDPFSYPVRGRPQPEGGLVDIVCVMCSERKSFHLLKYSLVEYSQSGSAQCCVWAQLLESLRLEDPWAWVQGQPEQHGPRALSQTKRGCVGCSHYHALPKVFPLSSREACFISSHYLPLPHKNLPALLPHHVCVGLLFPGCSDGVSCVITSLCCAFGLSSPEPAPLPPYAWLVSVMGSPRAFVFSALMGAYLGGPVVNRC